MKRWITLLLTAAVMASSFLTACGGGGAPASSSQAPSSSKAPAASSSAAPASSSQAVSEPKTAPVEIRATWWGDTKRNDVYNAIVDRFQEDFPHVTVVREPLGWGDYWDKLSVQAAGGNAPDFMGMNTRFASDYLRRGVCEPLDTYIADGTISLSGWEQATVNTGVVDGVNYMIPMGVTFGSVYINTGVFSELGITPPTFDWTWDDVMSIGQEVRTALDAAGKKDSWLYPDPSADMGAFRWYVRQHGRDIYDADGKISFEVGDAESWFAMFKELREKNIIVDPATTIEFASATLEDNLFSKDRLLAQPMSANQFPLYCATFPDKKLDMVRSPSSAGKAVAEFPDGSHFAISAKSTDDRKLAAAQLLNFWVNSEKSLELFMLDQGVPGNLEVVSKSVLPNLNEYQQKVVKHIETLSKIATPANYAPLGTSEIEAAFRLLGEGVQFETLTPADAAQQFYDQAVDIRSKN